MADLYEYSTPELVRLLGSRFREYRMRCNLTQREVEGGRPYQCLGGVAARLTAISLSHAREWKADTTHKTLKRLYVMITILKVILWDEEIGRLVWDARRGLSYFNYNPRFIRKGLDIAPLTAPLKTYANMPIWGEDGKIYQRLPSFIADSLPDSWGNQLFDLWRQQHHLSNADITPLDKLSFIGKRGMGALEFQPQASRERSPKKIDMASLTDLAERIFSERENARIMPGESITMQSLLTVGTSAGGRQPKAIIAINRNSGEIRSGQIAGLEDYDYYLLKFGNTEYSSAELEMTYYELARKAGIDMMPSRLYSVNPTLTSYFA